MRNEVIKEFIDKDSKKRYPVGTSYETADNKRIAFLQQRGFLIPSFSEPGPLDGNIEQAKSKIQAELGKVALDSLLATEKKGKNRKGVIEHIEQLLAEVETDGPTD